jgi:hypothetical protein
MGFYRWRLRISMAAALQPPQLVAHEQEYRSVSLPMRPRRFWRRLVASVAFLRCTNAILVAPSDSAASSTAISMPHSTIQTHQ